MSALCFSTIWVLQINHNQCDDELEVLWEMINSEHDSYCFAALTSLQYILEGLNKRLVNKRYTDDIIECFHYFLKRTDSNLVKIAIKGIQLAIESPYEIISAMKHQSYFSNLIDLSNISSIDIQESIFKCIARFVECQYESIDGSIKKIYQSTKEAILSAAPEIKVLAIEVWTKIAEIEYANKKNRIVKIAFDNLWSDVFEPWL